MKVLINNRVEKIDEGFTIDENYNETLDSAVIRISHLTSRWDIEPYDTATILKNNNTTYHKMCVSNFTCTEEAIGQEDTTFSYTINLFSLTKKLETVILPNLSITPRKIGTKLSVKDYILNLLTLYSPKHWVSPRYVSDWTLSTRFSNKFGSIECPEMQWTTPTLREVLNDLTMLSDCIVILNQEEKIDYIDITDITDVNKPYNYMQESHNGEDYISEIRMELQNVMQTNTEGINNVVTTSEFLTLTSNDAVINSDNCFLKTQYPILNIKHLWLIAFCPNDLGHGEIQLVMIKQDLCEIRAEYFNEQEFSTLVYEQKEYDTKPALYRDKIVNIADIGIDSDYTMKDYFSQYKNFCLHYVRNSNEIQGFNYTVKPLFAAETSTLFYLKKIAALNALEEGIVLDVYPINNGDNSYFSTFFQIEYETTYNSVFQASKGNRPRNRRVIADNQTNAWVDAYSQGFLEYQKANRLGNLQRMYNQRVEDTNDLFVIGDRIKNKVSGNYEDVVYRTEYQIYNDHIECNAYATKNYVLQNYFTGIKSKIRTWVNAQEEAFIRHDLKKYYCEFSYSRQGNAVVESINNGKELARYFLSSIETPRTTSKPIKYVLVVTQKIDRSVNPAVTTYWPDVNSKYTLNCITRLIGNSIVLTAGFNDNWIVDKHPNTGTRSIINNEEYDDTGIIMKNDIKETTNTEPPHLDANIDINSNIGGVATNYYRYCDDNGEFDDIVIYYLDTLNISEYLQEMLSVTTPQYAKETFIDIYNLPLVKNVDYNNNNLNTYNFGIEMPIHKDNKEKPVISTQFEFCVNDDSIKFTKLFLQKQDIIRNTPLLYARIFTYNENMNFLNEYDYTNILVGNDNDYSSYVQYIGVTIGVKYVTICDSNGNALLTWDITKNDGKLYLNIRRYL